MCKWHIQYNTCVNFTVRYTAENNIVGAFGHNRLMRLSSFYFLENLTTLRVIVWFSIKFLRLNDMWDTDTRCNLLSVMTFWLQMTYLSSSHALLFVSVQLTYCSKRINTVYIVFHFKFLKDKILKLIRLSERKNTIFRS